jgi:hypothetical protein
MGQLTGQSGALSTQPRACAQARWMCAVRRESSPDKVIEEPAGRLAALAA